jgi:hypothetical protein
MKNLCKNCGIEFEAKNKSRQFCSNSCAVKYRYKDPEYSKKMAAINKEIRNRPEVREAQSKKMIDVWKNPTYKINTGKSISKIRSSEEQKNLTSENSKENWKRPGMKEKMSEFQKEFQNKTEQKEKIRSFQLINQNLPNVKENKSNCLKTRWSTVSEYRCKMLKILEDRWNDPVKREHMSNLMIDLWKNDVYANKVMNAGYKYKEFILPSGKIVKLQGYEPIVLVNLLLEYSEDDIIIGHNTVKLKGIIEYEFDGKIHSYRPDFYIESINTIIEVKSKWTFNLHKEKNLAKEQGCIKQGFKFKFEILY